MRQSLIETNLCKKRFNTLMGIKKSTFISVLLNERNHELS